MGKYSSPNTEEIMGQSSFKLIKESSEIHNHRVVPYTPLVRCHTGERRYPEVFEISGFRVALAIASLPGMTIELCNQPVRHHTILAYLLSSQFNPRHLCQGPLRVHFGHALTVPIVHVGVVDRVGNLCCCM